jgi:hypothetical protein
VAQTAPTVNPRLGVNYHEGGYVTYSGVVKDETGRTSIIDAIKGIFGAGNVKGDITVNPNAAPAPWLANLKAALENFKIPGLSAMFDGSALNIGGLIADSDRDKVIGSLEGIVRKRPVARNIDRRRQCQGVGGAQCPQGRLRS